jgi:hypothetical protein
VKPRLPWKREQQAAPLPPLDQDAVSPDLRAWAKVLDVSRLTDDTARSLEWYLRKYRRMPRFSRREISYRLVSAIAAQVTPPPPLSINPLDIMATVLAVRRAQDPPGKTETG